MNGAFIVTICTHQRRCSFGCVASDASLELSALGRIVEEELCRSASIRHEVTLDRSVVMPNHLHGIVFIKGPARTCGDVRPRRSRLAEFVAAFKAAVSRRARRELQHVGPVWQRGYFDRVIRLDGELDRHREYVAANPSRWAQRQV